MRLVAAFAVPALVAVVGSARADDEPLRLVWSAPTGCPNADEVRSATLREVRARQTEADEVLDAEAKVEQAGAGWRVRLRTRRGTTTGEREIEATTCNGVAEATAVVLALALVPPAATELEEEPPPVPSPAELAQRDVSRRSRTANEERHTFAIGAAVAGDPSTLPAATAGGALTLAWAPSRLRVELDARRWASQSQTLSRSDAGARFSMTSLGGRACWAVIRAGGFELLPCGGADVHLVSAPGYGADANFTASAAWTTVTGGGLGRFELATWLALRARVEGSAPLSRPTFVVQNEGMVHRPPSVGAAATFGVEVLFL